MSRRGFTLLELLIVLALIGLVAAIVLPGLSRTYEAIVGSGERADVVRALEGLPLRVRASGRDLAIEPGDTGALAAMLELPAGWGVTLAEPLYIARSGLCRQSKVRVAGRAGTEIWTLMPPACGVRDAP
ncbi:MAG: prepilin-type N-terminal cleavage/methylation domain-containing protein [Pseudomonadota bacterium]